MKLSKFLWYKKIKWIKEGKPMIKYDGFHCGCCGKWISSPFEVPTYESCGDFWDTWGLCKQCKNGEINKEE